MKWNWVKKRDVYQCENVTDSQLVANVSVYNRGKKLWLWQANIFTSRCSIRPLDEQGWPTAEEAMRAAEEALLSFNKQGTPVEAIKPKPKAAAKHKQPAITISEQKVLEVDPVTRRFAELVEKVELAESAHPPREESSECHQDC